MREGRLLYIDMAKGISIVLVVFGHIVDLTSFEIFFYSFSVPVFFMITGMMKRIKGEWKSTGDIGHWCMKRFKSLIIPYFIFEVTFVVIFVLLNGCNWEIIRWNLIDVVTLHTRSFGPWFLLCLFIAEFVFSFVNSFICNGVVRKLIIIMLFTTPFVVESGNYYIVMIFQAFLAVGFMEIGYMIVSIISNKKLMPIFALGLLLVYYITNINGLTGVYGLDFGKSKVLFLFNSIVGTVSLMGICTNFNKVNYFTKIISFFGRNSLWFLGFHGPIILIMKAIVKIDNIYIQMLEVIINLFVISLGIILYKSRKKRMQEHHM